MRIVFIGPPGAGKGTQCKRISDRFHLPHISSGEMLRAGKDETPLGRLIASFIDNGHLAPDDVVMQFIVDRLGRDDCENGYLFDGFPRTLNQAEMLDVLLAGREQKVDLVLNLVAEEQVLIQRLLDRAKIEHRLDDTPEGIAERLRIFRSRTEPVLGFYHRQGLVQDADALQGPDDVFADICAVLSAYES